MSSSYRKPGLRIPLQPRLETKWSNLGPQGGLGNLGLSVKILFYPRSQITPNKPEQKEYFINEKRSKSLSFLKLTHLMEMELSM